jgi:tripartite-type tricarboxylate transporter receptor subunit TctC
MRTTTFLSAILAGLFTIFAISTGVFAQSAAKYPDKPIKIIVSFTAGGTTDILAREVANQMSIRWKVPVIVENKPGAAGNLGTEIVGRSAPDGYTLLANSIGPISINPTLFGNLAVNPQKALDPVALLGDVPNILVVPSSSGIKNWKEFLAFAKANSGNLNYGSTGIGTTAHLISFLFASKVGIDATHIPYKGAEATRDLVAGRLQFMFATAPSVIPLIKAGQLNAIAVSSKKRISAMPDLPTLNELGVDIATGAWFGLFAPAGTNPAIIKKLNETVVSILEEPTIRQKLLGLGADPILMNVPEFTKFVRNDYALWAPIVKASGAKPE